MKFSCEYLIIYFFCTSEIVLKSLKAIFKLLSRSLIFTKILHHFSLIDISNNKKFNQLFHSLGWAVRYISLTHPTGV